MFRLRTSFLLCNLVIALAVPSVLAEQNATQVLIERARTLDSQGRHDLAAENWRQVLLLDPKQPDSLHALAAYYHAAGNENEAKRYMEKVDSSLSSIAARNGAAANSMPDSNDPRLHEAGRLAAAHKYPEALSLFRQVFGNTPSDNWASVYYQSEAAVPSESASGIAGLRSLVVRFPANPAYRLTLAEELTYRAATRAEGMRMLSTFEGTSLQGEQARAAWRRAILWDPSSRAAIESSKAYLGRYSDSELASSLQQVRPRKDAGPETSPEEGAAYRALEAGKLNDAVSRFTALSKDSNTAAHGEMGLGYVAMRQSDFDAAIQHFESAGSKGMHGAELEKAIQQARFWSAMSNGHDALRDHDTATASAEFERAHAIDGNRPEAAEAWGDSMLESKDLVRAQDLFASNVKSNPSRPDAWIGLMKSLLDGENFDRVIALQREIPSDVRLQLGHRPDYLAILLCAELALGDEAEARMLRDRITKSDSVANASTADVTAARLLFRFGYFDDASRLAVAALNGSSSNSEAWETLVEAEHMAGRDRNALTMIGRMPRSADARAMGNSGFLLALASIYQSEGQLSNAAAALEKAQKLSGSNSEASLQIEMQKASLAAAQGDAQLAYDTYHEITTKSPDQLDAWIGMVNALHAANRDADALGVMSQLPDGVSGRLAHDSEYLQAAGFVYNATGHTREALRCLRAVTEHYAQKHQPIPFGAGIALAWLQLETGEQSQLADTLDHLGKRRGLSLAQTIAMQKVWSQWSVRRAASAYESGDSKQAMTILQTASQAYPADGALRIELASMYVRTGKINQGMKIFRSMEWTHANVIQFTSGINAAIAANSLSDAQYWLYLGLEKFPGDKSILRTGAHLEEKKGDLKAAEKYLKLAGGKDPEERLAADYPPIVPSDIEDAAPVTDKTDPSPASELLRDPGVTKDSQIGSGDSRHSHAHGGEIRVDQQLPAPTLDMYSSDDMQGGSEISDSNRLDPVGAQPEGIGELVRVADGKRRSKAIVHSANEWAGAESVANERASSLGSEMEASSEPNVELREAVSEPLRDFDLNGGEKKSLRTVRVAGAAPSLESLLSEDGERPARDAAASAARNLEGELLGAPGASNDAVSESAAPSSEIEPAPYLSAGSSLKSPRTPNPSDELQDLEARYSPWLLGGASVETHSGTLGFDYLQHFEAGVGASTVLGTGTTRISVVTRPVMLQSGIPDSKSNYRFGTGGSLPTDSLFAAGTAASLQLATQNIQVSVGNSPSGFLVNNLVGDFTYRPRGGPFTFDLYRASQKDSMLSYSGFKDPSTGEVWGGVVATGASMHYTRGTSTSGFYASVDGQRLTGKNVVENTRIMGDAGAYWQPYFNQYGALKIGANINVMHYAKNERYFTVGQGGYFSPDSFLLMNAPISWEGRPIYNTSYSISASLGAQSIQQSAALPGSLITGSGVETSAGASYDLHLKIAHRMDQHWTIEGFFDANNARQYTDTAAGFALRYATRPQSGDMSAPGFMNLFEPLPLQAP